MRLYYWLAAGVLLIVSCGKPDSELRQTAGKLRPGMDRATVAGLFAKFGQGYYVKNESGSASTIPGIHIFNTNSPLGAHVVYNGKGGFIGTWEDCTVWFDTNGVIVAYRYQEIH